MRLYSRKRSFKLSRWVMLLHGLSYCIFNRLYHSSSKWTIPVVPKFLKIHSKALCNSYINLQPCFFSQKTQVSCLQVLQILLNSHYMFTVCRFGKHGYYQINVLTKLMTKFNFLFKHVNPVLSKTLSTVSSSCLWSIVKGMSLIFSYTELYLHFIILKFFPASSLTGS